VAGFSKKQSDLDSMKERRRENNSNKNKRKPMLKKSF